MIAEASAAGASAGCTRRAAWTKRRAASKASRRSASSSSGQGSPSSGQHPLGRQREADPRGHDDAQPRAGGEELLDRGGVRREVLEVVEHEQECELAQVADDRVHRRLACPRARSRARSRRGRRRRVAAARPPARRSRCRRRSAAPGPASLAARAGSCPPAGSQQAEQPAFRPREHLARSGAAPPSARRSRRPTRGARRAPGCSPPGPRARRAAP